MENIIYEKISNGRARNLPTEDDISETKTLFRELGIRKVSIPRFNALYELLAWRKKIIREAFE